MSTGWRGTFFFLAPDRDTDHGLALLLISQRVPYLLEKVRKTSIVWHRDSLKVLQFEQMAVHS